MNIIDRIKKGEWIIKAELGEGYVETQDLMAQVNRRKLIVKQLMLLAELGQSKFDYSKRTKELEDVLGEIRNNSKLWKAGGAGGQDQYTGLPPMIRLIDEALKVK